MIEYSLHFFCLYACAYSIAVTLIPAITGICNPSEILEFLISLKETVFLLENIMLVKKLSQFLLCKSIMIL